MLGKGANASDRARWANRGGGALPGGGGTRMEVRTPPCLVGHQTPQARPAGSPRSRGMAAAAATAGAFKRTPPLPRPPLSIPSADPGRSAGALRRASGGSGGGSGVSDGNSSRSIGTYRAAVPVAVAAAAAAAAAGLEGRSGGPRIVADKPSSCQLQLGLGPRRAASFAHAGKGAGGRDAHVIAMSTPATQTAADWTVRG